MFGQNLWTTTGAARALLLSILNVVSNCLIRKLNSASDGFGVNFSSLNLCENCFRAFQERFFDIFPSLGTCFEENQIVFLSKVAGLQERHLSSFFEIFFVADQNDDDVRACECSGVIEPVGKCVE